MEVKPFLKWVGGKTQILDNIIKKFPNKIDTYYEPFIGGGSIFIHLLKETDAANITINKFHISDINYGLINTYNTIKNDIDGLINKLDEIIDYYSNSDESKQSKKREKIDIPSSIDDAVDLGKNVVYYYYRDRYNKLINDTKYNTELAALFIFLNKTCFRGLYRESKNGFNVPFGNYSAPTIYEPENLVNLHILFNKYDVIFENKSFDYLQKMVKKNDFIYLDPPYYPIDDKSFVSYNENGFDIESHKSLYELCNNIDKIGAKFVKSNSYVKYIIDLYKKYSHEKILCNRQINSKKPDSKAYEIIIWN